MSAIILKVNQEQFKDQKTGELKTWYRALVQCDNGEIGDVTGKADWKPGDHIEPYAIRDFKGKIQLRWQLKSI